MSKKTKTAPIQNTNNISYAIPKDVANSHFLNAIGASKDSQATKFVEIMSAVQATCSASFTVQDVMYHAKPYSLEPTQTVELFNKWKEVMLSLHKIDVVAGCYDDEI